MTRAYRLGRRAAQQAATRARIVAAARDLYLERGMAGTSMVAVAAAADVATNTVRNHFATPAELAAAVGAAVLAELELPDPTIFDGVAALPDRLSLLASALAALSVRGEAWWSVMQREPALAAAWKPLETAYDERLQVLTRAALGAQADDPAAIAVVTTLIGPPVFYGLQQRGLSAEEATAIGLQLTVPWLERRRRTARSDRTDRRGDPG